MTYTNTNTRIKNVVQLSRLHAHRHARSVLPIHSLSLSFSRFLSLSFSFSLFLSFLSFSLSLSLSLPHTHPYPRPHPQTIARAHAHTHSHTHTMLTGMLSHALAHTNTKCAFSCRNHYDVEKSIRRLLLPEQLLQVANVHAHSLAFFRALIPFLFLLVLRSWICSYVHSRSHTHT